ncbi:MAG: hypothetical protein Aurels2KO_45720 [Aureliella sp.]
MLLCFAALSSPLCAFGQADKPSGEAQENDKPKQTQDAPKLTTSDVSALSMRSIGPALMSGRIADLAIDPVAPNTWYVAAGSGNVWKTENSGTTWKPIFDNYSSYSIGCVTLDPSNHSVVWVGTGENVSGRHVGFGDGIYVSHNGGKSFQNKGLKKSEHISKIVVHPRNSDRIFVAAQGPLWSSGGERGLYRTTDGGENWELVLSANEWTGCTDIAMDPRDPDTLYAALHQRHRTVWGLIDGGPDSGVYKSTDGGTTWKELKSGLPGEDKGKMSIAVSPQKSNVVYVTIELADGGGVFRSEDFGESWKKVSDYVAGGTGPHYYQEIYCDPHRFDVLYHANVQLGRSEDGGATWSTVSNQNKHVDNHAVAFHPADPNFLLVGCDGGLYRSYDYAKTYQFTANLPLTQFYKVAVSYESPFYHVVGGTQDNNTQYGPVQTRNDSGIRNADWRITIGGDGHDCAIDPENPEIIYSESQQGYLRRFDRRTGQSVDIKPQPAEGEDDLRHNWDSPIEISPHSSSRLYFGSKKLHRSDDRGDSWTAISPDLSRGVNRLTLPHMDRVWSVDSILDLYAMSAYGNITSIDESPVVEGLIYVGTDDGLIQITEDGGQTWRKVDKIFDVPEYFFVNDIKADRHDPDTVYVAADNHKTGDYTPYLLRSRDRGKTWESIVGDLPERHLCWRVIQDHVNPDLLFLGTEFGAYFTVDAGAHWTKLPGTPTIPFRDLEIQRDHNDLVGATFGRGFYVLDDYSPLRELSGQAMKAKEFSFLPTADAPLYIVESILGGSRGSQGDSYFIASNPDFGAVFTYFMPESLKTLKAQRSEREAKEKKAGEDSVPPTWDELRAEERETAPVVELLIRDTQGRLVARIPGAKTKGLHRTAWNLRYTGFSSRGPLVVAGEYTVEAIKRVGSEETQLAQPVSFNVVDAFDSALPRQAPAETLQFQVATAELMAQIVGGVRKLDERLEQIGEMRRAVARSTTAPRDLLAQLDAIETKLSDINLELSGDPIKAGLSHAGPVAIASRVQNAYFGTMNQTYGPTKTHRQQFDIAKKQYDALRPELQAALDELDSVEEAIDEAGVIWTSGRKLP